MNTYALAFIYPFLATVVGALLWIYVSVLLSASKPFTPDSIFKYASAGFFVVIIFGSVITWFLGSPFPLGLPTFGLENRPHIIG